MKFGCNYFEQSCLSLTFTLINQYEYEWSRFLFFRISLYDTVFIRHALNYLPSIFVLNLSVTELGWTKIVTFMMHISGQVKSLSDNSAFKYQSWLKYPQGMFYLIKIGRLWWFSNRR